MLRVEYTGVYAVYPVSMVTSIREFTSIPIQGKDAPQPPE